MTTLLTILLGIILGILLLIAGVFLGVWALCWVISLWVASPDSPTLLDSQDEFLRLVSRLVSKQLKERVKVTGWEFDVEVIDDGEV